MSKNPAIKPKPLILLIGVLLVLISCSGGHGVEGDASDDDVAEIDTPHEADNDMTPDPGDEECAWDWECHDGDPCTSDRCDLAGRCAYAPSDLGYIGDLIVLDTWRLGYGPYVIAWSGSEYGAAWGKRLESLDTCDSSCHQEIVFARVGPDGENRGLRQVTDDPGLSENAMPSLAWTGSEWGLAWTWNHEPHFKVLSGAGEPLTDPVSYGERYEAYGIELVWTGSEFGSLTGYGMFVFSRLSAGGEVLLDDVTLEPSAGRHGYCLSWTGSEFGLAWAHETASFATLAPDGSVLGDPVVLNHGAERTDYPRVEWTGSVFGVAWGELRDAEYGVNLGLIDSDGASFPGGSTIATDARGSAILEWTGSSFLVEWYVAGRGLLMAPVNPTVPTVGNPTDVYSAPSVAWSGSELGTVFTTWNEETEETSMRFGLIGFCE